MSTDHSRSHVKPLLPLFLVLILAILFLDYETSQIDPNDQLEEFALGEETSIYRAMYDRSHIQCMTPNDGDLCIEAYKESYYQKDLVLWLGNSQLHAINQMSQGDINAVEILHHSLRSENQYLMAFSYPNASLQQHYVTFEYLAHQLPIKTLVLPVVFDDMRETGVGNDFSSAFETREVVKSLSNTKIGESLVENSSFQDSAGNEMLALHQTVQERSEKYLNEALAIEWNIWAKRPELRGEIIKRLYRLRNTVFGINASSVRNKIPGRYFLNIKALTAILASSKEKNINVLIYIVPLRSDVKTPYNIKDYADFKEEIEFIALSNNAMFADLESVVPSEEWGRKDVTGLGEGTELDFMHFQAAGHERLAKAIGIKLAMEGEDINSAL